MSKAKEKKQVEEAVCQDENLLEQEQVTEKGSQKKVNILPNKKETGDDSHQTVKKRKKKTSGKRAEYTVKECGLHAKKKFGVSSEVFFIATREAGKEDLDLITLVEAERILIDFMKREVK